MAARPDLLGDVAQLKQARARPGLLHESAHTWDARQETVGGQLVEGAVGGHARDAEMLDELVLGRHALTRRPGARSDLAQNVILDAAIKRSGLVHERVPRTTA